MSEQYTLQQVIEAIEAKKNTEKQLKDMEMIPESIAVQFGEQIKNELTRNLEMHNKIIKFANSKLNEPTSIGTQVETKQGTIVCNNIEHRLSHHARSLFEALKKLAVYVEQNYNKEFYHKYQNKICVVADRDDRVRNFYICNNNLNSSQGELAKVCSVLRRFDFMGSYPTFLAARKELVAVGLLEEEYNSGYKTLHFKKQFWQEELSKQQIQSKAS